MKRKILICIIILLILIVLILFLVKFITINTFLKKVNKNFSITNFQYELVKEYENNTSTNYKYFKLDSTLLIIPNENVKIFMNYDGNNSVSELTIDEKNKVISRTIVENPEYFTLSGNLKPNYSFIEKVKMCFNWKIDYEEVNGIDCIVITDENNNITYYNRENAYMVKNENIGEIINIQINSVTEEDMALPNLEGYTEN